VGAAGLLGGGLDGAFGAGWLGGARGGWSAAVDGGATLEPPSARAAAGWTTGCPITIGRSVGAAPDLRLSEAMARRAAESARSSRWRPAGIEAGKAGGARGGSAAALIRVVEPVSPACQASSAPSCAARSEPLMNHHVAPPSAPNTATPHRAARPFSLRCQRRRRPPIRPPLPLPLRTFERIDWLASVMRRLPDRAWLSARAVRECPDGAAVPSQSGAISLRRSGDRVAGIPGSAPCVAASCRRAATVGLLGGEWRGIHIPTSILNRILNRIPNPQPNPAYRGARRPRPNRGLPSPVVARGSRRRQTPRTGCRR
jgi:hypothetical protein